MRQYFVILVLSFWGCISFAQEVSIPFEEDGLVYIPIKVGESQETLQFVFDTGASTAVIDSKVAERLGIKADATTYATGANGSQEYKIVNNQRFELGSEAMIKCRAVLVDLQKIAERSGRTIDGIIGADILSSYLVHMDFDSKQLKGYDFKKEIPEMKTYQKLKLRFKNSLIPVVDLELDFPDGEQRKGSFLFDSGANLGLIFNTPYVKKHQLNRTFEKKVARKVRGLTTETTNQQAVLPALSIGDYRFSEVPVELSESASGVTARANIAGILGAMVINKFNYIFDYDQERFYYAPNQLFDKAFQYPMSGLSFVQRDGIISIDHVIENSPAALAGIKEGDVVLSVNEMIYNDLNKMREEFQKEGESVNLVLKTKVERNKKVVLKLNRLI